MLELLLAIIVGFKDINLNNMGRPAQNMLLSRIKVKIEATP